MLYTIYRHDGHLSKVYCLAVSRQNSAAPSAPHAIPYRALFKHPNGPYTKHYITRYYKYLLYNLIGPSVLIHLVIDFLLESPHLPLLSDLMHHMTIT